MEIQCRITEMTSWLKPLDSLAIYFCGVLAMGGSTVPHEERAFRMASLIVPHTHVQGVTEQLPSVWLQADMYMHTEDLRSYSRQKTSHVAMSCQCIITPRGAWSLLPHPLSINIGRSFAWNYITWCKLLCLLSRTWRLLLFGCYCCTTYMETSVGACSSVHNLVEVCCW